jgi:hypothetical protein
MSDNFTVGIALKPYVHRYLVNAYGYPVNLYNPDVRWLRQIMIECLRKPEFRFDKRILANFHNEETRFVISNNDFYRYGWIISKTDMLKFNARIESEIKFLSRTFISIEKCFGVPISTAIRNFQIRYDFTEDDFPYETIKKDLNRNGDYIKFDEMQSLIQNYRNILLEQLSEIRQVS